MSNKSNNRKADVVLMENGEVDNNACTATADEQMIECIVPSIKRI
jgi:hypothetical protein